MLIFLWGGRINTSDAVSLEAGDWHFGINGFLDGEYTWMDKMPMVMKSGMLGTMEERSFLDQHHMNLLFGAETGKSRININLQSLNSFSSANAVGNIAKGQLDLKEAYGIYSFHDLLKVQVGYMLSPFGIYNDVRYITPLFATVVLPQMYEMPGNYRSAGSTTAESVPNNLMPTDANFMLLGSYSGDNVDLDYYFYVSNGERAANGIDTNKDKGIGTRLKATVLEDFKFGFSYFSVNNSVNDFGANSEVGKEILLGFDAELNFSDMLKLEAEYVYDEFEKRKDRHSYYVRLTGYVNKFSPFFAYDYAKDKANNLYKRGQARYGAGTGYKLSDFVTVKGEYHLHVFNDEKIAPALPMDTNNIKMFRASMIFVF